jgi:hypothetical protein
VNDLMAYFARIGAAILLIKFASTLVKDAERLITANVKARNPEVADEVDHHGLGTDETSVPLGGAQMAADEWPDPLDSPSIEDDEEYREEAAQTFAAQEADHASED